MLLTPCNRSRSIRTSSASRRAAWRVDVPNGRYRVFVNIDSPSGFWGEYQTFRERTIVAEGRPVVRETMDFDAFKAEVLPVLECRGLAERQHV